MLKLITIPALAAAMVVTVAARPGDDPQVTICHATGAGTYIPITVDDDGTYSGHINHQNDIIPAPDGVCPGASTTTLPASSTTSSTVPTTTTTPATSTSAAATTTSTTSTTSTVVLTDLVITTTTRAPIVDLPPVVASRAVQAPVADPVIVRPGFTG